MIVVSFLMSHYARMECLFYPHYKPSWLLQLIAKADLALGDRSKFRSCKVATCLVIKLLLLELSRSVKMW